MRRRRAAARGRAARPKTGRCRRSRRDPGAARRPARGNPSRPGRGSRGRPPARSGASPPARRRSSARQRPVLGAQRVQALGQDLHEAGVAIEDREPQPIRGALASARPAGSDSGRSVIDMGGTLLHASGRPPAPPAGHRMFTCKQRTFVGGRIGGRIRAADRPPLTKAIARLKAQLRKPPISSACPAVGRRSPHPRHKGSDGVSQGRQGSRTATAARAGGRGQSRSAAQATADDRRQPADRRDRGGGRAGGRARRQLEFRQQRQRDERASNARRRPPRPASTRC